MATPMQGTPTPRGAMQGTPTGRPRRARRVHRRKNLFPSENAPVALRTWSVEENRSLLEFVLLHGDSHVWPTHARTSSFWANAADFVTQKSSSSIQRTADACRAKVMKYPRKFSSPEAAVRHFWEQHGDLPSATQTAREREVLSATQTGEVISATQTGEDISGASNVRPMTVSDAPDVITKIANMIVLLPEEVQLETISKLFSYFAEAKYDVRIATDFLELVIKASEHLSQCGRSNVVYGVAQAVGRMRPDGSDSRLPAKRMPMGLLEYMVNFFNAPSYQKVGKCPEDYRQWLVTMYTQFGNKWSSLHNGPKWSIVPLEQTASDPVKFSSDPMEARVNIPGLSSRYIRRLVANTQVTTDASIQKHVIDEAAKHHPDTWWWVKADGCDLIPGLSESTRGIWSGDVDLSDGDLEKQHQLYASRILSVENLQFTESNRFLTSHLKDHLQQLKEDLTFLHESLQKAQASYEEKLGSSIKVAEKTMFNLAWQIQELQDLHDCVRKLAVGVTTLIEKLECSDYNPIQDNFASKLSLTKKQLLDSVKKISKHQRTAATHVFVFMVSPENRCRKPYALPVQCLPIRGLKDSTVREMANKIITAMLDKNMNVAGFTTNGEFNSLRWKGHSRPLTVLQVKSAARSRYQKRGYKSLMSMLTPLVTSDGCIVAKKQNPAVSKELLAEIYGWRMEGASDPDVLCRLRQRSVPAGYSYHFWCPGKTESPLEMARSILAQLHYKFEILEWERQGIPFRSHIYVPEVHPITGHPFQEREDEAHVFKRIAQSLRNGGPRELHLERFMEAVYSETAQLSYHALIGTRKQSVKDVEQIFSLGVLEFFEENGYSVEAEYVRVIRNWRRASDERGLTDDQRAQFNRDLISYILDDLMPWHSEPQLRDFSLLEVNRDLSSIRGFTRETLSALVVDIESREWRRRYNKENNIPPEHPRASTTDDVECFFSVLRDMVGRDFTHKEVMYGWRKACVELSKRLDKDLPFYYHTSTHHRFFEGDHPDFSVPPVRPRVQRVARRELMTGGIGGRTKLAQRGAKSIRTQFHNVPVELPPPPGVPTHVTDHSY